jgi:hypothetical protein
LAVRETPETLNTMQKTMGGTFSIANTLKSLIAYDQQRS